MTSAASDDTPDDLPVDSDPDAQRIGDAALRAELSIAVAESLTGGAIAQALAKAPDASTWFAGGVVAYTVETKHRVLGVPMGPVVTAPTARQMAEGVRELLGADIGVAVTGVGGPGHEEGRPPGTVYLACATVTGTRVYEHAFDGEPEHIVEQTVQAALRALRDELG